MMIVVIWLIVHVVKQVACWYAAVVHTAYCMKFCLFAHTFYKIRLILMFYVFGPFVRCFERTFNGHVSYFMENNKQIRKPNEHITVK